MKLSIYHSVRWLIKLYIVISFIFIVVVLRFTDIIKQENYSTNFATDSICSKTDTNRIKSKRRICILNIDTRPLEKFTDTHDINQMQYYSVAAYNNLFYANRHGYDYLRITPPPIAEHNNYWPKVVQLYDIVHKYDIVVFLDSDTYFSDSNISIEFLLARYNFTDKSSFLMSTDPNHPHSKDSKGRIVLNTGFIIAQNNNLTRYILKKWTLCTKTIPGCDQWKKKWTHEQSAFNEYIRDEMKVGSELITSPCNDTNGFDGSGTECSGNLLKHVWSQKHTVIGRLQKIMINNLMTILEKEMWQKNYSRIALTSDIEKLEISNNTDNMKMTFRT